jgi:hypothetical protein
VLVKLNYETNQNLPQVNIRLAAMGTGESIAIYDTTGVATVGGPVTCTPAPGVSGPQVKVLEGSDGTPVIGAGQSAGNTAEGTFHLDHCVTSEAGSGDSANSGKWLIRRHVHVAEDPGRRRGPRHRASRAV